MWQISDDRSPTSCARFASRAGAPAAIYGFTAWRRDRGGGFAQSLGLRRFDAPRFRLNG